MDVNIEGEGSSEGALGFSSLSRREREVLAHLARGLSRAAIAKELYRSPKTIDNHCTRIYKKLGVRTQSQLVGLVHRRGLDKAQSGSVESGTVDLAWQDNRLFRALSAIEARVHGAGEGRFFGELVAGLAEAVGVDMAGVCEYDEVKNELVIVAGVDRGKPCGPQVCPVGSRCMEALESGEHVSAHIDVLGRCPCGILDEGVVRGYASVRLERRSMGPVGSLWIADRKPLKDPEFAMDVLRSLRWRVGTEVALQIAVDRLDELGLPLTGEA